MKYFRGFLGILLIFSGISQVSHISPENNLVLNKLTYFITKEYKVNFEVASEVVSIADNLAVQYKLPVELILAVAAVESSFRPEVISKKGAIGIMQVHPSSGIAIAEPKDYIQNLAAGTNLLNTYITRYGIKGGIMSYNAGPNKRNKKYLSKVLLTYNKFSNL